MTLVQRLSSIAFDYQDGDARVKARRRRPCPPPLSSLPPPSRQLTSRSLWQPARAVSACDTPVRHHCPLTRLVVGTRRRAPRTRRRTSSRPSPGLWSTWCGESIHTRMGAAAGGREGRAATVWELYAGLRGHAASGTGIAFCAVRSSAPVCLFRVPTNCLCVPRAPTRLRPRVGVPLLPGQRDGWPLDGRLQVLRLRPPRGPLGAPRPPGPGAARPQRLARLRRAHGLRGPLRGPLRHAQAALPAHLRGPGVRGPFAALQAGLHVVHGAGRALPLLLRVEGGGGGQLPLGAGVRGVGRAGEGQLVRATTRLCPHHCTGTGALLWSEAPAAFVSLRALVPRPCGRDGGRNVAVLAVEFPSTAAELAKVWNTATGEWLRFYFYERLCPPPAVGRALLPPPAALLLTQAVAGVWHGLRPGQLLFFAHSVPMLLNAKALFRLQRGLPARLAAPARLAHSALSLFVINYLALAFVDNTWEGTLAAWGAIGFCGHWALGAATLLALVARPPPKAARDGPEVKKKVP